MGDFNEVAKVEGKKGGAPVNIFKCKIFISWIEDCNLIDLGAKGPRLTWKGAIWNGYDRIFKRLDRLLANNEWVCLFNEALVKVLPRTKSNHNPLLLMSGGLSANHTSRPFRFEAAWLTHGEFRNEVSSVWKKEVSMDENLANLTKHLKWWNQEVFRNIFKRKKQAMARLEGIQRALEVQSSTLIFLNHLSMRSVKTCQASYVSKFG
ncbi:RNA-directed DNA polymerase (Reverse transcriptase) Ribonuclease H [Quillaja saponaria]|uniref:RNA-directed DNA polymerase (Reverse transcriptase) Ribonuclease H n=1 Tax=Quillaja saponaria TaxID=32244 RepID=A0AAD7QE08_QUISA|nr:RNA-directed DNA polymerase (Reverse transcriptase) Ribonuclease H [Quillaja saponaria]